MFGIDCFPTTYRDSFSFTGVDHGDFPRTVLRGLEAFLPKEVEHDVDAGAAIRGSRWKIPDDEIIKRRDLRKCRIFTIDPTGARDLDDALSVTPLADGTFEVGVHIADVTYFVRPNSDLDREARRRATTVYLVQQARTWRGHDRRFKGCAAKAPQPSSWLTDTCVVGHVQSISSWRT